MIRRAWIGIAVAVLVMAGARSAAAQAASQSPAPTAATDESLPLAVRTGSPGAPVQFAVFCDVSDEACVRLVVVFAGVLDEFRDQAGVTFRHLAPKEQGPAHLAYRAVLAAARQGRGWQMLDLVCANTDRLDDAGMKSMASQLGLDLTRFEADAGSAETSVLAEQHDQEAAALNLDSAPAVLLNGARLPGPYTLDALAAEIRKARGRSPDPHVGHSCS